jgi:hypothetical protein
MSSTMTMMTVPNELDSEVKANTALHWRCTGSVLDSEYIVIIAAAAD